MAQIKVGISDLNVATKGDVLVTYALGSCVGICIYDSVRKIAGLSHIMLPDSRSFNGAVVEKHKFADTAITELIKQMERRGATRVCMTAKIAGGAKMFASATDTPLSSIGERNVIAVKQVLAHYRIPIKAEDIGKNYGRTQFFDSATGVMTIKSVSRDSADH